MSNVIRRMNRNILTPGISVGAPSLNLVQVPNILWTVNGRPRKIFIEAFDVLDKTQAQRDAWALSGVMVERVFGKKNKDADDRPIVREADG